MRVPGIHLKSFLRPMVSLRPIRLWKFRRNGTGGAGRIDWQQRSILPLEQVCQGSDVLTGGVELDVSLDGLEYIARMQFGDQFGLVETVVLGHSLCDHLSDRVGFGNIRANSVWGTAILGNVSLNHVGIARIVGSRVPAVRNHDCFS